MGVIISKRELLSSNIERFIYPIIFPKEERDVLLIFPHLISVNLNIELSRRLLAYESQERKPPVIEKEILTILRYVDEPILLKNIEILFDPSYYIDVLRLLININRRKKLLVEWPGIVTKEFLIFAEPNYKDYKKFLIDRYDITCII